jgi:serine/threonine-protein phosphatase 2B catalytic subunit
MLLAVLSVCSEKGLTDADTDSLDGADEMPVEPAPSFEEIRWRRQEIKNKILAVGMERCKKYSQCSGLYLSFF